MLSITKIFRFETAHAISDYNGKCKNLHGHSYVLHVTVTGKLINEKYLENFGFIVDFKELKEIVTNNIINKLDHSTILSKKYIDNNNYLNQLNNLIIWEVEPSAENILLYIRDELKKKLPNYWLIKKMKLFETADSYAEWEM